jgi:hypothetical protein
MRINYFPGSEEPNEKHFGQRKKKLDAAVKIDAAIKEALDELETHPERRAAFLRLLAGVRAQTGLLKPTPGQGSVGWCAPVFLINRLRNLASRQGLWLRPVETWCAQGGSLRVEFRSLARHLLALYPVPGFMDSVWDLPAGAEAFRQQVWFIRLGRGARLRSLNLPIVLTRQMEHHARRAPEHYTVIEALRYGETRGLGGSHKVACEVATSRLGRDASNAPFWRTVLRFVVAHPGMPLSYISPILDFIQANKFAGEEVLSANGVETRAASWPEFTMEGRTPNSLLRLVRAWNSELDGGSSSGFSWEESGFQAYQFVEKRPDEPDLDWSVVELLNSSALHAEGRAMRHCVYTYANKCRRRETTIWSLRLRVDGEEKRKATIEVDPQRNSIVQIRAKRNRRPGLHSRRIIRQWAVHAGLEIDARA